MEKRYHRHVAYIHTYIYQLIEKETQGETEETSNTYTLRKREKRSGLEKRPRRWRVQRVLWVRVLKEAASVKTRTRKRK